MLGGLSPLLKSMGACQQAPPPAGCIEKRRAEKAIGM
jgi:hypothetical protein